ncbi:class I SAM-dependent methyltransferase, partial [Thermoflexus sp.]|uniref:class I SAM-dependent methyltransferase n=1 Tax=Thermoflexus sp. TaxID=1969742 RepID=UPI002ADD6B0F
MILEMYQQDWASQYLDFYLGKIEDDIRYFEEEYLPKIGEPRRSGRFLDLGCGAGASLMAARRAGWEVYGVEVGEWARSLAQQHGLNVFVGTLEEAAFPDGYFDVVFCKSVLEHLYHPRRTLREIHRVLKEGGLLVCVGIPNWDSFAIKVGIEQFVGNAPPEHLYYFQEKTIKRMLEEVGFTCEEIISGG